MKFTKMQGCGNDYVYVDGAKEVIPQDQKPALAKKVSDRHFGIGSDGLIFINPVDDNDIVLFRWRSIMPMAPDLKCAETELDA